ncbi:MAG: DUF1460 domain-containing protein [Candidatus Caldarchaeum sp.]
MLFAVIFGCTASKPLNYSTTQERITFGFLSEGEINSLLNDAQRIKDPGERIAFISEKFLGTPYMEHTLVGGVDREEMLVVNLMGVDCFTYIDYIEALRLSRDFREFKQNLALVRYEGGRVSYTSRNHFFTDWSRRSQNRIQDVTQKMGLFRTRTAKKRLNLRGDGTLLLPGVAVQSVVIHYIPSSLVDEAITKRLKSGDYIGIFTEAEGLDVSHTGIFIRKGDRTYLRHASSREGAQRVVDDDFKQYISSKPGIVVLRAK